MAKRKHTAEEIINKLRKAEVVIAGGVRLQRPPGALASRSRPSTDGAPSTAASELSRRGG